jgi:hypothetical protein
VTTQTPLFDAVQDACSRSHSPERWTDADRPTDWLVGRDPRRMAQRELRAMGHEPMSPMEAIRAKCLDCCAGSLHEVRCCVAMACPSWPRLPPPARRTRLQREPKTLDPPRPPVTPAASFDGELGCPSSDTATEQYGSAVSPR